MRLREHSSAFVLSLLALAFALAAGVLIPLISGRPPGSADLAWTPPPTSTATAMAALGTATSLPPKPATRAVDLREATAVPSPTATRAVAPAEATVSPPTTVAGKLTPSPLPTTTLPPASLSNASPNTRPGTTQARMLAGPLNLRAGPGVTFTVLGVANKDDEFSVLGLSQDGAWVQVCCVAGAPVWVSAQFVQLPAAPRTYPVVR